MKRQKDYGGIITHLPSAILLLGRLLLTLEIPSILAASYPPALGYPRPLFKKSRHAANMKAGRVVQTSVMMGCYDLQCTCSEVCTL
jgi:hypothetical protein